MTSSATPTTALSYAEVFNGDQVCIKSHCKFRYMYTKQQIYPCALSTKCSLFVFRMSDTEPAHSSSQIWAKKNVADIKPGQSTGYYVSGIVLYTEVGECGPSGYYPSRIFIAGEDRTISEVSALACQKLIMSLTSILSR